MADRFPTTQWHLVLTARAGPTEKSHAALAALCQIYWYPLYAFIRHQNYSPEEAQDLTQAFFARLLERHFLDDYVRERGRFRSFLLAALKHFLANERDWRRAQKRGGGLTAVSLDALIQTGEQRFSLEPRYSITPESIFEKQWALTLLDHVLSRLQRDFAAAGKQTHFDRFKGLLIGDDSNAGYAALAGEIGMTEGAVKVAVHRMRQRYRQLLREEIANTVAGPAEVDEELQHLLKVLAR